MYGKRLLTLLAALIGSFLLFMILSFYLYPVFNPTEDEDYDLGDFDLSEFYEYNYLEFGPAAIVKLRREMEALEEELERLQLKEEQDVAIIDSLFQANLNLENDLARAGGPMFAGAEIQEAAELTLDERTREVARSLLRLDEDELRPIINRLSDNQLVDLYQSSSNLQREQMLRSLEPAKAATLLRNVLS